MLETIRRNHLEMLDPTQYDLLFLFRLFVSLKLYSK